MLSFLHYFISFTLILSFIVFIHEFGHYFFAKKFGVKIEEFAIGFGREIFGWNDKSGTRWKFCLIPLGGYVKMYGDRNAASTPDSQEKQEELVNKEQAFIFKPIYQKFLIVLAGPLFNYLLAIIILFFLFASIGVRESSNVVNKVTPNLAADIAGLQEGDKILAINGRKVRSFSDIQKKVQISPNIKVDFTIERDSKVKILPVTPNKKEVEDFVGNKISVGFIGVSSGEVIFREISYLEALPVVLKEIKDITILTLDTLGQLITGKRSLADLGGPLKIAKYSGQVTEKSLQKDADGNRNLYLLFWFIAMISINLGFANLLPIPVLDGGHLLLYIIAAIRGKELPEKAQQIVFKLGFVFLITIFIFVSFYDIKFIFGID